MWEQEMHQQEHIHLSNLVTKKTTVTAGGCEITGRFAFVWDTFEYTYCREVKSECKKDVAFAKIQRNLRKWTSLGGGLTL